MTGTATDIVKPADLPRSADGKMAKIVIAFDVDGTLIHNVTQERAPGIVSNDDVPIVHWINTLQVLSTCKNVKIVVWSGGGEAYARMWGNRLGLDKYVWRYASKMHHELIKGMCHHLIAIDDIQSTLLGDINLIVKNK